jgi:hypothetical protein
MRFFNFNAIDVIGGAMRRLALMAYEYKCVSGPTIVAVKNTRVRDQAVKAFEDIMNIEAAQGWEFVGIDEFHVSEPQGFLSRKRVYVPAKILVFRREKAGSVLSEAMKFRLNRSENPGSLQTQSSGTGELQGMTAVQAAPVQAENTLALTSKNLSVTALIEKIKSKRQ